ncbi:hypothetical protein AK812_SmicGene21724 [Symbiodinium microadriaticum]|uniref:Uncharacterized protein n=1 Tax=Symbiodinium microadriaticum TaxID=2951 RepID=A0A1Q9DLK7_SYMMI|nr:hypothetical protein AK812_SmicGene21724 [Symbiodinium microadriaticum]CAE7900101.1 unnamed protein product [Symbiodinium microadriaticum]
MLARTLRCCSAVPKVPRGMMEVRARRAFAVASTVLAGALLVLRTPTAVAKTFAQPSPVMEVDPEYPGTAVERLRNIQARVKSLTPEDLSKDWEEVRRKILWAGGLKDLPRNVPGQGYTGHSFNDDNHCDLTPMLGEVAHNLHGGEIRGIAMGNRLGPGIEIASLPELGPGGSWSTCTNGCHVEPPQDVAHVQFRARIAFKLVWTPPHFTSFVLVDDSGAYLNHGSPTGALPDMRSRTSNYNLVKGSKYAREAEALADRSAGNLECPAKRSGVVLPDEIDPSLVTEVAKLFTNDRLSREAFTFLAPENVSEDVAATSGNAFEIAEMSYLFVRDSASRRDVLHDLALARDFPEATAPQETDSRFPFLEYSGSESQARKRQSLMLVPLGAEPPAAIPEVISAKHVYGWYSVTLLLAGLATAQITAGDAFAGVIFLVMAGFVVYMVQDSCKNMTMYCLFMLGLMASFQCFFDALALLSVLGGRETSVSSVQGTEDNVTVITRITQHPFFDQSMGKQYNTQSAVLLASPLVMSLLASMCYLSYNAFSESLFHDEAGPIYEGWGQGARAYGASESAERTQPSPPRLFEGHGHRLSS